jgi:signal peptidase I
MSAGENMANVLAEEVVRSVGKVRLRVLGTSMAPSILPGDLLSIQRVNLDEISLGEIVLFSQDGRLFVHRVVSCIWALPTSSIVTRGDRLSHNDPPVTASQFLGRVTSIERGHRRFAPVLEVRGWRRLILRVLRASDRATRAYVHSLTWLRNVSMRREECGLWE